MFQNKKWCVLLVHKFITWTIKNKTTSCSLRYQISFRAKNGISNFLPIQFCSLLTYFKCQNMHRPREPVLGWWVLFVLHTSNFLPWRFLLIFFSSFDLQFSCKIEITCTTESDKNKWKIHQQKIVRDYKSVDNKIFRSKSDISQD